MIIASVLLIATLFSCFSIFPHLNKKNLNALNFIVIIVLAMGWIFIFKVYGELTFSKTYTHAFSEEKVFLYKQSEVYKEMEYKYLYPRFFSYNNNSEQNVAPDTLSKINPASEKVCIRFVDLRTDEVFSDLCSLNPEKLAFNYAPLHKENPNFVNFLKHTYYDEETKEFLARFKKELETLALVS